MENSEESSEAAAFIAAILSEMEGSAWLKSILRQFLRHSPGEACDAAALLHEAMEMRANEAAAEIDGDFSTERGA